MLKDHAQNEEKMNCPNCQTPNPDDARFCMNCGTNLLLACSNCGTELPAGAKFCSNCGHKVGAAVTESPATAAAQAEEMSASLDRFIPKELLAKLESARSSRAMEGERRTVTMLFCDVQGSTATAGQLDPEEWAEIINGAFEHMIAPIYRYEGTLARLMGDAILAFFGAPIAHEDDPQRAILAGLEIVQSTRGYREKVNSEWGIDIDVRVGINTGLVVVGAVGSDLRTEYTALGDAVNLAARMEQTARPGTVQIAEDTYKLVAPLFEFEPLGEIQIKGKEELLPAYRVLRPKAEPGRLRGVEGLESPLVGRDAEMHTLRGSIIELRQGRGQIISIMGEAGLGKSRLVTELRTSPTPVAGGKAKLLWLEGRSLSYETSAPYAPFIDLFGRYLDLQADKQRYDTIKSRVTAVAPQQVAEIAPFLATLLNVEPSGVDSERIRYLEPPQLRDGVFQAVVQIVELLASEQPVILVLDDVHWIDPTSLELLQELLPITERAMLMIVALFRPRRQEPSWRFHEHAGRDFGRRYKSIALQQLDGGYAQELIENLLHVEDLPERVRNMILDKAEGNPFFMEEVIRSLLDAGLIVNEDGRWRAVKEIEKTTVPDTLAAVITTRLDRLDEESRQVLQTASVIGRDFPFNTLSEIHEPAEVVDPSLISLQRRELIRERSLREYTFKHALTQETVYASLLLKARRQLHLRVAECLETNTPKPVADIARHYLEARQPERALPYLIDAGDNAARAYSTPEAIAYYKQALGVAETTDNLLLARRAFEGLGGAYTFANDVPAAVETYQVMLARAEEQEDVPMQVSALNKLSFVTAMRMGQFEQADGYLAEADRRARTDEDKAGLSEMSIIRCMMCTAVADFEGVVRYMDEAVALGKDLDEQTQMVMGLAHIASSQLFMLQFEEAWGSAQEGLALSREIGDLEHEAEILGLTAPLYHVRNGDFEAAQEAAETGIEIARRIGALAPEEFGLRNLALIAQQRGEYETAINTLRQFRDVAQKRDSVWSVVEALCETASAYLDISPAFIDRITGYHDEALELLEHPAGAMMGASAWAELGYCMQTIGNLDEASELFEKGLTIPTITGNLERPRLLIGSALLALSRNDTAGAERLLGEARALIQQHSLENNYPLLLNAEAKLRQASGDLEEALALLSRAEELAREMGLRPLVWRSSAAAAAILNELGRESEAEEKRRSAQVMIEEIAGLFEDPSLSQKFLDNAQSHILKDARTPLDA
jgi:class 3 adenylate cyclase/tetratricopeptide (TPR) repeat protein